MIAALALLVACASKPDDAGDAAVCPDDARAEDGRCLCGEGPWTGLDATGTAAYVDDDAAEGGDGSSGAPFARIADALDAGTEEVLVEAGAYTESLRIAGTGPIVRVRGRCRELVTVTGEADDEPVLEVDAQDTEVTVSGLTLTGGLRGARIQAGDVAFNGVTIAGTSRVGLVATSRYSLLALEDVDIRGVVPDPSDGSFGWGVQVADDAEATLVDVTIEDVAERGLVLSPGAPEATLTDVTVTAVRAVDADPAYGILAGEGAAVTGTGITVRDVDHVGIAATGAGTELSLSSVVVEHVGSEAGGVGVSPQNGAEITLTTATIRDVSGAGVWAYGNGETAEVALATLTDVTVEDTRSEAGYRGALAAIGVAAISGADVDVLRPVLLGLLADGPDSRIDLDVFTITDAQPDAEYGQGVCALADGGATIALMHGVVDGCVGSGLTAQLRNEDGTVPSLLELLDVVVTDIRANDREDVPRARGVEASFGGRLAATGLTVSHVEGRGVSIGADPVYSPYTSNGLVSGLSVSDVFHDDAELAFGIAVHDGSNLLGTDVTVREMSGQGVAVWGGATAALTGVTVEGVEGTSLAVYPDASVLSLTDCVLTPPLRDDDGFLDIAGMATGGTLGLQGCEIGAFTFVGVYADAGAVLDITDTTLAGALPDEDAAYTVAVSNGSRASIYRSTIHDAWMSAVLVDGLGSSLDIYDSTIDGVRLTPYIQYAIAVSAQQDAVITADGLDVRDVDGPGLQSSDDATLWCTGCTIDQTQFAGAIGNRGTLLLEDSTITGTGAQANLGGGVGVYVTSEFANTTLVMQGNTVSGNRYAAVWLDGPGDYEIWDNDLEGGVAAELREGTGVLVHGNAVVATGGVEPWDEGDARGAYLMDNRIVGGDNSAVLVHDAALTFLGNTWTTSGVAVTRQACNDEYVLDLAEEPDAGTSHLCDGHTELLDDIQVTVFLQDPTPEE